MLAPSVPLLLRNNVYSPREHSTLEWANRVDKKKEVSAAKQTNRTIERMNECRIRAARRANQIKISFKLNFAAPQIDNSQIKRAKILAKYVDNFMKIFHKIINEINN